MTAEELRLRFLDEIDRRGRDDKYIDGVEERELLQIGLAHGFTTERARNFLLAVCRDQGYVVEAALLARIRESLRRHGDRGVSRHAFEKVLDDIRPQVAATTLGELGLKKLVLNAIADEALPVRRGLFSNWFTRAKREAGA
jgi:hypothetical protein